jgi:hypothetical protein
MLCRPRVRVHVPDPQVLGTLLGVNISSASADGGGSMPFPPAAQRTRAPEPVVPEVEMTGA